MNTIGQNQGIQATGPGVQVQDKTTRLKPTVEQTPSAPDDSTAPGSLKNPEIQAPAPQLTGEKQYLDPEQMQEFIAKVSEAIRKASIEPHLVGFTADPDSEGYLIEIRKADGTLITRFTPEKILNLHGNLDDLSGMVIDRKS